MGEPQGQLSIIVIPEGSEESRTYTLSRVRLRVLATLASLLAVTVLGLAGSWWFVAQRAALADDLTRQVDSLTARQVQLEALAGRLGDLEDRYNHLRSLFGSIDQPESDLWLPRAGSSSAGRTRPDSAESDSEPTAWPLTIPGFITRPLLEGADGDHPGVDIAVPTDSYILAAGGGQVVDAADDPTYGRFVLVEHAGGLRSLYGHASMLLVERGQRVRQGEVIALSGSTGRSTAPHLHFEILRYGNPVDPLTMVTPP